MILLLSLAVLSLWLIRRQWRMRKILKVSRLIRSKYTAWPIIGHGLMFLGSAEDRMTTIQKFAREAIKSEYGIVSAWLGSQFCVVTCEPSITEVITKTCLGKSGVVTHIARHLLGNASVFAPVDIWRPRRKVLIPVFSAKNFREYVEIFAEQSKILTQTLYSKVGTGTFSIWKNFTSYTMDTVCETTLGVDMHAQKLPLHPFLLALKKYLSILPVRLVQPSRHWEWLFNLLPIYKETETTRKIIHDFVNDLVKKKQVALEHEHNNSEHDKPVKIATHNSQTRRRKTSFLDELILSSGGINGYTDVELREETLTLLIAGNDTSAAAASFTTVMLSRHMDVQEKAYQEIYNIFGESERLVTYEDLPKLIYMEALIKETLRLYPPSPVIMRENDVDVPLTSGIILPAGTYIAINIWGLHRNPQYWGADAEEFNPDRFLNGSLIDRTTFMPFSFGPRDCLGSKYGMMSLKVAMTTLLRKYKVLPPSHVSAEDLKRSLRVEYNVAMKDTDNFEVVLEHRT